MKIQNPTRWWAISLLLAVAASGPAAIIDFCTENISQARVVEAASSKGGADNNKIANTNSPVRAGQTAFWHWVTTSGERAELAMKKTAIGGTYWYGWSMMLGPDYQMGSGCSRSLVMQLATYPSPRNGKFPCSANGSYMAIDRPGTLVFYLQRQGDTTDSVCTKYTLIEDMTNLRGVWIDFVMHAKWTGNPDGFLRFWVKVGNGEYVQRINYTGRTFWNDEGDGPYFKMGLYMGDPGWSCGPTRSLFTDEYRLGDANSSFQEVAPGGGSVALPSAPTGVAAVGGTNRITVSWNAVPSATSYRVKRSATSGGSYSVLATGLTSLSYTNLGLGDNETWWYRVSAVNAGGEGPDSAPVSATTAIGGEPMPPAAPTNLRATATAETTVLLTWEHASPNGVTFEVERAGGGDFAPVAAVVGVTNYTVNGLAAGALHQFRVRATNAHGASEYAEVAEALTPIRYETWAAREISDPERRGPEQDANGNGMKNFVEYALDLRAGETPPELYRYGVEDELLVLRYTRNKAAVGVRYEAQVSGDMATWVSGPEQVVETVVDDEEGVRQWVEAVDVGGVGAAKRFLRVVVTRQEPQPVMVLFADWAGPDQGGPYAPTMVSSGAEATALTKFTGGTATWPVFNRYGTSSGYSTAPVLTMRATGSATTKATALANGHYADFTVSATGGGLLTLTNVSFLAARGGSSTPRGVVVRTSADGYAADVVDAVLTTVRPNWPAAPYGAALGAGHAGVGSVTFRVYMYGENAIELDNLLVEGWLTPAGP